MYGERWPNHTAVFKNQDGGLTTVPIRFSFDALVLDRKYEIASKLSNLSFHNMTRMARKFLERGINPIEYLSSWKTA